MEVSAAEIRELVDRPGTGKPVSSVYLNTDGARFPRASDYEARLDGLLRDLQRVAAERGPEDAKAVEADVEAIGRWVRQEFDRGQTRGLGLFCSEGDIFERVEIAESFRNIARVGDTPYVVPLEAMLGRRHHIALVIIERDKARVFRYQLGRAEEFIGVASDVHGQHSQGGWSQARFSRNIEHEFLHHMKDTAEVLLRLHEQDPVDALVIAGPQTEAVEFTKILHPYVQQVVHGDPVSLPVNVGADELRQRFTEVEQELTSSRRRALLERLAAAHGQAEKAARGIRHVLEAVNTKRVEVLFVVEGAGSPGYRSASGALALHRDEAASYGEPVADVDDLVDECIEEAVRAGAHIELFRDESRLDGHPIAALLRF